MWHHAGRIRGEESLRAVATCATDGLPENNPVLLALGRTRGRRSSVPGLHYMYFLRLEGQFVAAAFLQADHVCYGCPRLRVLLDVRYLDPTSRVGAPVAGGFHVQYYRFPACVRMHTVLPPMSRPFPTPNILRHQDGGGAELHSTEPPLIEFRELPLYGVLGSSPYLR
jgi:hypothetical protein